jgi:hypothetical protein
MFFDFLFYLIYKFYKSYNEKGAESSSAGIIGGFLSVNVLTLTMTITFLINGQLKTNKLFALILILFFQVYAHVRYIHLKRYSVECIEEKWLNQPDSSRRKLRILLTIYGITSILMFFGLALYIGSKR